MNYELALKLKNAGFPQKETGNFLVNPNSEEKIDEFRESAYSPNLIELLVEIYVLLKTK